MSRTIRKVPEAVLAIRERHHAEIVEALRDNRKQRAVRFDDKKRQANKRACRGQVKFD